MPEMALDKSRFRRKYMLRLLTAPTTLAPAIVGATALLGGWSLGMVVPVFAGVVGLAVGCGVFLTKLAMPNDETAKATLLELEEEARTEREQALDALERRLAADNDARDEDLLRDLRQLAAAFREDNLWRNALGKHSTFDIMTGAETLFAASVRSLEQCLELVKLADKITTETARRPIEEERERVLQDVQATVEKLGQILTRVQGLQPSNRSGTELSQIREELDLSLEVAARVEARMNTWPMTPSQGVRDKE